MKKALTFAGIVLLLLLGSLYGGFQWGRKWANSRLKPKVDTLVVYKWKTAEIAPFVIETTQYTMPYYIFLRDSSGVADSVAVPVVEREYRDSNYVAVVTGPKVLDAGPVLTSLQVREQVRYITRTVEVEKRCRWSVGPYAGCGVALVDGKIGISPTVGLSVQWALFSW